MKMQAYYGKEHPERGTPVPEGAEITDFRGKKAFFVSVASEPRGNSTGRIATVRPGKKWPADEDPTFEALMEDRRVHSWPEQLSWYQEYYPSVYGLEIW